MEEIEKKQSSNGSDSVNASSSIMGPKHLGRLRLYGRGVTKRSLRKKATNSEQNLNITNDAVKQM